MEKEIWIAINWINELPKNMFYISSMGRVHKVMEEHKRGNRTIKSCCFIIFNQFSKSSGYFRTNLIHNGVRIGVPTHRLVAQAFISNPKNKPCIHHINNDRSDYRIDNLMWVTVKENNDFCNQQGRRNHSKGTNNPSSILSDQDVINISNLFKNGRSVSEISKMYNVSSGGISSIITGSSWKHIKRDLFPSTVKLNIEKEFYFMDEKGNKFKTIYDLICEYNNNFNRKEMTIKFIKV